MGNKLSICSVLRHSMVLVGNKVFIWGGDRPDLPTEHDSQAKQQFTSTVDVFNVVNSKFVKSPTTGTPPNGTKRYASCCIGDDIYYFGGSCDVDDCFHNNLFVLNTGSYEWREIKCDDDGPMRKHGCGMIPFSINGEDYLLVIGGYGPLPSNPSSHAQYTHVHSIPFISQRCYTNEVHIMCVSSTPGKWTVPVITGSTFPPLSGFSINTLPGNRGIIFGGTQKRDNSVFRTNNIFIVSYTNSAIDFMEIIRPPTIQWPMQRAHHSSAIISGVSTDGIERHYLVVLGGWEDGLSGIADCWILMDIDKREWNRISLPRRVTNRFLHSMCCFKTSENYFWLIITGGRNDLLLDSPITSPNGLMIVELVFSPNHDNWTVTNVLNEEDMKKYTRLVSDRLLETSSPSLTLKETVLVNGSQPQGLLDNEGGEQVQLLKQQLKLKEQEIQRMAEEITTVRKEAQMIEKTTQQNTLVMESRRKDEIIQEYRAIIQKKEALISDQEANIETLTHQKEEISQKNEALLQQVQQSEVTIQKSLTEIHHLQKQLQRRPWILEREEVELTEQILGGGAFGEVRVAIFRGTRVAAKLLHKLIVSRHNKDIFTREMEISSGIHHPNIVQFIGATRINNPILLYELMATSLHKRLQDDESLTRPQIIDIAFNVCTAMCYLHQWRPQPIIHRDISSPNVLMEPLPNDKWRAKLSDLGSANLQLQTKTVMAGNPAYAAPEAIIPRDHTPAMDMYSFGVLLTEMTLHRAPEADSLEHTMHAHSIDWIEMRDIVLQCINDDRSQRLTSEQLLTHLQNLLL